MHTPVLTIVFACHQVTYVKHTHTCLSSNLERFLVWVLENQISDKKAKVTTQKYNITQSYTDNSKEKTNIGERLVDLSLFEGTFG